jgi:hypothetical protein
LIHTTKPTTKPTATSIHPIFVFSKIISFPSLWIGENSVSFYNQFKFLFIATLYKTTIWSEKRKKRNGGKKSDLIRMMFETFPPIRLLNIRLSTIFSNTQNLIIIFRLAPLQRRFSLFQLAMQSANIILRRITFRLGLLNGRFEIRNGGIIFFEMKINSRSCPQGFKRRRMQS